MNQLLAGFCRMDLTPEEPVALGGYGDDASRLSEDILDPITGTCLALTDEADQTVLLLSLDLLLPYSDLVDALRTRIPAQTGIPAERIMVATTHTHAAPGFSTMHLESTVRYLEQLAGRMAEAAMTALADRAPAKLFIGRTQTEKLSFVRHYRMENGTYGGDNFGTWDSPITQHASEADEQIQLVKFTREGKQDILLMNWQAHGKMSSTITTEFGRAHRRHVSADYIGYARTELEAQTGNLVIFFSGAAGNLNPSSRMESEPTPEDPAVYGKLVAQAALPGLAAMEEIPAGAVQVKQKTLTLPTDHSDDHKVELARSIWALWTQDQQLCKDTARANGFNSAYAARDVISRSESGAERTMTLHTVTVGDLAFVAAPYEMFCANGQQIKEGSPYAMTVIMSCTNAYHQYLASDFAFTHGGYEVDSRKYPRGTAEKLVAEFLQMLQK